MLLCVHTWVFRRAAFIKNTSNRVEWEMMSFCFSSLFSLVHPLGRFISSSLIQCTVNISLLTAWLAFVIIGCCKMPSRTFSAIYWHHFTGFMGLKFKIFQQLTLLLLFEAVSLSSSPVKWANWYILSFRVPLSHYTLFHHVKINKYIVS